MAAFAAPSLLTSKGAVGYGVAPIALSSHTSLRGQEQLRAIRGLERSPRARNGGSMLQWRVRAASTVTPAKEEELVELGQSGVKVSKIGIGSWSWGDRLFWNSSWDGTMTTSSLCFCVTTEQSLDWKKLPFSFGRLLSMQRWDSIDHPPLFLP